MRRLLPVLILAFVVVACTPGDSAETTTSTSPTVPTIPSTTTSTTPPDGRGGTVRVAVDELPVTVNPVAPGSDTPSTRLIGNALWARIYDIDPGTWDRIPDVVLSMPTDTPGAIVDNGDGTITVQYQVHPDARWSDGIPISGEDLAFTAEVMSEGALRGNSAISPIMASVVATDSLEKVAWITFDEPSLAFEDALWVILPSHAIGDGDPFAEAVDWPSGGPFVRSGDDPSTLERNPQYWKRDAAGTQLPYADAVQFVVALDGAEAFEQGVVDVAEFVDISQITDPGTITTSATALVEHLTFNFGDGRDEANPESQNDELDFRRALAYAVNRPGVLEATGVDWLDVTPGILLPGVESAWSRYDFDPAASRDLLAGLELDAEPPSIQSTTSNSFERPAIGEELAIGFQTVGVAGSVDLQDSIALFNSTLPDGTFDTSVWAWVNDGSFTSVLGLLDYFSPTGETSSFSGWGVRGPTANDAAERFAEIAASVASTVDPAEFRTLVAEAEDILADQLPLIPLFYRTQSTVVRTSFVEGVVPNGSDSGVTWNLEQWSVVGE